MKLNCKRIDFTYKKFHTLLYAGIAYCYRLFRHFSLWKILSNLLISPYVFVFKSSMWSSKFSIYYYAISRFISVIDVSEVVCA